MRFLYILFFIFLTLKLLDKIDWSWPMIFSPLILHAVFWFSAVFLISIGAFKKYDKGAPMRQSEREFALFAWAIGLLLGLGVGMTIDHWSLIKGYVCPVQACDRSECL